MNERSIEAEVTIRSGVDAEVEAGRGIKVNVADVNLEPLTATENGAYSPGIGVDGFSDVTVALPAYSGQTEVHPGTDDVTLETEGRVVPADILIHGIPEVPHTVIASGSFVKQGTGVTYTLDTHSTKWKRLLIKPHEFPHAGMAASALSRAIMTKYIDLELDAMITAYMSSAGTAYNAGSYKRISTGDECDVTNGVVRMTGEQSAVGKWIDGKPIYRRVFKADSQVTITNSWKNVSGITDAFNSIRSNIEMISEARFFADASSATSLNRLEFREDSGQLQIMVSGAVSITFQQLGIVLEYTKIT